ncbi:hypothetical protein BCR24_13325 [Enterococcus ureilyticus]|uniref:ABC transporter domain-containing protein n=1 Tax=Enterococcus ureilyticus TaxID=1131292 RepID=A0A1E5HDU6_9ENTE|nr:ABC transporter ATP-binding protein [Enterococcus ureilyticus]MBM7689867.1 ABC-type multidrug transport system fused ATPase/permease subunit [Enterococcus ureilyticus]OEG23127.1 hypothetical protein BCR24_13325 [Enterococcus ureilyticus]
MFEGLRYYIMICWKYNSKYILLLIIQQFVKFINMLTILFLPKYIIDNIFTYQKITEAIKLVIIFILTSIMTRFLENICIKKLAVEKIRTFKEFQLYLGSCMMKAPLELVESKKFLDLKNKSEQFIYAGGNGFGTIVETSFSLVGKLFSLATFGAVIATLDIYLLISILFLLIVNMYFNNKIQKNNIQINIEKSVQERRSAYFSGIFQNFHFGKEIRIYNLSSWLLDKYNLQLTSMLDFYKKLGRNSFYFSNITLISSALQQILTYIFIIKRTIANMLTIGDFSLYLTAINSFTTQFQSVISDIIGMNQYTEYYKYYLEYINVENIYDTKIQKDQLNYEAFEIRFENVSFVYKGQKNYALKNIKLSINKGDKFSIVGKNGAGKSTFVKLLLGIYKPTSGKILVNGRDIQSINYEDYIKYFSTIFQDFKLFSLTLSENIAFESEHKLNRIKKEKIDQLLKLFGMKNKFESKKGQNTMIFKDFCADGYTPSGGEAQRISIIRALYNEAPIMVLDEPSSALDPEAEFEINNLINEHLNGKTCIYITHRLSSTKNSNKILVFDKGKIVEQGTHDKLLNNKGLYCKLYHMQSSYY